MSAHTREQLSCAQTVRRRTGDAITHLSTPSVWPLADPHYLKRLRQIRPALILRQHTATGEHALVEPPMPQIDRAYSGKIIRQRACPGQVVRLGAKQQPQIIIQCWLVLFHNPALIAASFDDLCTQAALGKHGIASHQHALKIEYGQHRRCDHQLIRFGWHRDL